MTEWSLSTLVRDVLESVTSPNPTDVTAEVLAAIPPEHQHEAFVTALHGYVRHTMSRTRYQVRAPQTAPEDQEGCGAQALNVPGGTPSRKVAAIRETWRQMLNKAIPIGATGTQWKFLGDCREGDLKYAAETNREMAQRNLHRERDFLHLRSLLHQYEVDTVRELPTEVLATTLGAMIRSH